MPEYPYSTHLNILKGPLETIDVGKLADECEERWWNQTLCQVNASVVRSNARTAPWVSGFWLSWECCAAS